jgi:hypothetical protein
MIRDEERLTLKAGGSMTTQSWTARGQYYETCSCDFVCPCVLGQMAVEPSKGTCTFAIHVDALGLRWKDTSGKNNGQYAPFNWRSA